MKTFYIIGAGGRTGAMFCRELQNAARVIGVAFLDEAGRINSGKIKIARGGGLPETFNAKIIAAENFAAAIKKNPPDFLWLATRNPVGKAVEFYYRHFTGKDNPPSLILSQNGLSAVGDAKKGLRAAMGQGSDKVKIIRVSLINGIDLRSDGETSIISYKLPVKLGFGVLKFAEVSPMQTCIGDTYASSGGADLGEIFRKAGIRAQEFRGDDVLAMENAKLFLNLIGMVCAAEGVDAGAGWRDKTIFQKEIAMLREFVLAAEKNGGGFANNLGGYPVKFLARLALSPVWRLAPFRGLFARIISKGRNRPKDLSEIDYYNGEVVKLGEKANVPTPVNEEIIAKARALK